MSSSSSFRPSMKASLLSRIELIQSNLALLPLDDQSASNPFVPSGVDFWTPEEAIRNHTRRDLRIDQTHLTERWNGGQTDSFILNGNVILNVALFDLYGGRSKVFAVKGIALIYQPLIDLLYRPYSKDHS